MPISNMPSLYFIKRETTYEERYPEIPTYEKFVDTVKLFSRIEPMKANLNNLEERYLALVEHLKSKSDVIYTIDKFSANDEKSFIENFKSILTVHPTAKLLDEHINSSGNVIKF